MGASFHFWAGLLAGLLSLLAYVPYVTATLKGQNKPNRATWIIWGMVSLILLTSYKSAGATHALWLSVANVLGMGSIIALAFRHCEGGWTALDVGCLVAAGVGVGLWFAFDAPLLALTTSLGIDAIGALPTLKKAYLRPHEEDLRTWLIFWIANTVNLFALEEWTFAMALYPVYMFLITGTLVGLLSRGRCHQA